MVSVCEWQEMKIWPRPSLVSWVTCSRYPTPNPFSTSILQNTPQFAWLYYPNGTACWYICQREWFCTIYDTFFSVQNHFPKVFTVILRHVGNYRHISQHVMRYCLKEQLFWLVRSFELSHVWYDNACRFLSGCWILAGKYVESRWISRSNKNGH